MALGSRFLLAALLGVLTSAASIGGISLPPMSKNPPILELNGRCNRFSRWMQRPRAEV